MSPIAPGSDGRARRGLFDRERSEVERRDVDVGHEHLDAHLAALGEVDGGLVLARLHAREERGEVLDRMVSLQPRGLVRDEAIAIGVALAERVVGERLDEVEQLRADLLSVPGRDAARDELLAFDRHQLADLLAACLAEVVGVGERVATEALRDAQDRLLVDHQPVGFGEHLLHVGMDVADRLAAVLTVGEVGVHVRRHRPRPIQRDECARRRRSRSARAHASASASGHLRAGTPRSSRLAATSRTSRRRQAARCRCRRARRCARWISSTVSSMTEGSAARGSPS